jgi:2'-5' RNA ligase
MKEDTKKRIFIGLKPDKHILKNVKITRSGLENLIKNWVSEENLHITLIPPWKTEDTQETVNKFNSLNLPTGQLQINLNEVEIYAPKTMLWAKGKNTPELIILRDFLLKNFNLPEDNREFLIHMRLAKNVDQSVMFPNIEINWSFIPDKLTLYESVQSPEGMEYKTLTEIEIPVTI